ncbi:MAG: GWxTD domain-containing protein, partial [Candidatus Aminicenantales bacterium]
MRLLFIFKKQATARPFFPSFGLFIMLSLAMVILFSSCHLYKLEQKLDPANKEFLSKVRYIITKKERKIFLELPESEREKFKEEFWKKRDPDPSTEENEFKMEYFNRVERANELFISEGRPGWLTDRGRIFILFGPPTDRLTYPMGGDPYSYCREIWYYGNFPIVFVDSTCTGTYRLVTYDLTPIREFNLMYMHELNLAQARAQQTIREKEQKVFDFDWKVKITTVKENRIEGTVIINIPYAGLWFTAEEEKKGKLWTTLDLKLELKDAAGASYWKYDHPYKIETTETALKKDKKAVY